MQKLNSILKDPALDAMNFLNEVPVRFPHAISFAPGRPHDDFINVKNLHSYIDHYVHYSIKARNVSEEYVYRQLGQYGASSGIICDILALHVQKDLGIVTSPESIVVTVGCQEAMLVSLSALCDSQGEKRDEVLFVADPTYVGIIGVAKILGIEICPVRCDFEGIDLDDLELKIKAVRASGKNPRVVYDIPDHSNPLGSCLSLEKRKRLLLIMEREDMNLLEDGTYGLFSFGNDNLPSLKSLDKNDRVFYLGSFAKSLCPGLRLGFIITDSQKTQELSKIKSFTTLNTSPIIQAMVGGLLVENDFSLKKMTKLPVAFYKENRDVLLANLEKNFSDPVFKEAFTWNVPNGGFFITMNLPFEFHEKMLLECAAEAGVIVCPMSYLCIDENHNRQNQIRLSYSYISQENIQKGIQKLAHYFSLKMKEA